MYLYIEKQFDGPSQYMKRRINIDTWKERERESDWERERERERERDKGRVKYIVKDRYR